MMKPVRLSLTTSSKPPTFVTTTGTWQAEASRIATPKLSLKDKAQNTEKVFSNCGTWECAICPKKLTLFITPRSFAKRSNDFLREPSPAMTKRSFFRPEYVVVRSATARRRYSIPYGASNALIVPMTKSSSLFFGTEDGRKRSQSTPNGVILTGLLQYRWVSSA